MNEPLHNDLLSIKELWIEFDPIGVYGPASTWPMDEYDAYVMPTYELLHNHASKKELEAYIMLIVTEHMGLLYGSLYRIMIT